MKKIYAMIGVLTAFLANAGEPPRIALILDKGGKDDKSFNAAAFRGALEAKQKFGIQLKEVEATEDHFFEPAMRSFISKKYDLIIAIGVAQAETVRKLSKEFPQQKFALMDSIVESPNTLSAVFDEEEGSYLVGTIAAMKSQTGHVGFIGGMDIPLIRRFEKGFVAGAKAARPLAKVKVSYVGVTSEAWNNPTKANELARSQYAEGVDVIFVAAGASNMGCFDAAAALNKFAIGVDSNQNGLRPGRILTSMLKRVDLAVFHSIEDVVQNRFHGGVRIFGLKNAGIDWALDENNKNLFSASELKKIAEVKKSLIAGTLKRGH